MSNPLVSVVAPVYNEEELIGEFICRWEAVARQVGDRYSMELILVDDGSTDRSSEIMKSRVEDLPSLTVVELRRNYGQTQALQAGLDHAEGDLVVTMDADLQHFPEEIPLFLDKLAEGYDMVCGWRHERAEGPLRRWPSRAANMLVRWISGLRLHDFGTTFRAYRRDLVRDLRLLGEFHRFVPALGHQLGGRICEIPIRNIDRQMGRSKYGLSRTPGVLLDLVLLYFMLRYLDRPMRAFGKLGLICGVSGLGIISYLVAYAYLFNVNTVIQRQGWFILGIFLLIVAAQLVLTGFMSEILAGIHFRMGDTRAYHVRRVWNSRRS